MSDIQEEQKRLYKRAKENDKENLKYMSIEEALNQIKQRIMMHELEQTTSVENEREKVILNYINKQKEVLDKIKEKGVMYYDPEYSKIYGELCSMPGANNTRTPVIVIDDKILELLEEIE